MMSEIKKHNAEKNQLQYLHVADFEDLVDSGLSEMCFPWNANLSVFERQTRAWL